MIFTPGGVLTRAASRFFGAARPFRSYTPPPMATPGELYPGHQMRTFRVRTDKGPSALQGIFAVAEDAGAEVGEVRVVATGPGAAVLRDVSLYFANGAQLEVLVGRIGKTEGVTLVDVLHDALEVRRGGVVETRLRVPLECIADLRRVYTPGVAVACKHIQESPKRAYDYTHIGNRVAIVTNGTAILGLGDIGPLAGLPVMEGKAAIFRRFAGISAEPVLVDSKDPKVIIDVVERIHLGFGAIQLEDIAAPECFEVEDQLAERLPKPVLHDDQWGTATVVLAGLVNSLRRVGRKPEDTRAVILGSGASGIAIAKTLVGYGVQDIVLVDRAGAVYRGRTEHMTDVKRQIAEITNKERVQGSLADAMRGRDLFIGVSAANQVSKDMVRSMSKDPIVFALANPVSEITVEEAYEAGAAVALDGRSMNNALAYPGLFRGALDARAPRFTTKMRLAAAYAVASAAPPNELLPDMFDAGMHAAVGSAVARAWQEDV
jgi:malate dehydrogenase (oxaloacetate-decarboxylating)